MEYCLQACRPQASGTWRLTTWSPLFISPQTIRRVSTSWSCPLWTVNIKLLTIFPKWGHMVLSAWVHYGPPCLPGKVIKLPFSTSPETLSLTFDLTLEHREVELSASFFFFFSQDYETWVTHFFKYLLGVQLWVTQAKFKLPYSSNRFESVEEPRLCKRWT